MCRLQSLGVALRVLLLGVAGAERAGVSGQAAEAAADARAGGERPSCRETNTYLALLVGWPASSRAFLLLDVEMEPL